MSRFTIRRVKTVRIDGQRVEITKRSGRGGDADDYSYDRPDGSWGAGYKSIERAIEAAEESIQATKGR